MICIKKGRGGRKPQVQLEDPHADDQTTKDNQQRTSQNYLSLWSSSTL